MAVQPMKNPRQGTSRLELLLKMARKLDWRTQPAIGGRREPSRSETGWAHVLSGTAAERLGDCAGIQEAKK